MHFSHDRQTLKKLCRPRGSGFNRAPRKERMTRAGGSRPPFIPPTSLKSYGRRASRQIHLNDKPFGVAARVKLLRELPTGGAEDLIVLTLPPFEENTIQIDNPHLSLLTIRNTHHKNNLPTTRTA